MPLHSTAKHSVHAAGQMLPAWCRCHAVATRSRAAAHHASAKQARHTGMRFWALSARAPGPPRTHHGHTLGGWGGGRKVHALQLHGQGHGHIAISSYAGSFAVANWMWGSSPLFADTAQTLTAPRCKRGLRTELRASAGLARCIIDPEIGCKAADLRLPEGLCEAVMRRDAWTNIFRVVGCKEKYWLDGHTGEGPSIVT